MKIKRLINLIVVGVFAVLSAAILLIMRGRINDLPHENLAKGFSNSTRFSQITLFIPQSSKFTVDKINYLHYNLDQKLTEKSITPVREGARLYVDCYSAFGELSLSPAQKYSSKKSSNALACYVGGDYRTFYPEMWEYSNVTEDVNHDRILLSKTAAWQLFGGYELQDFEVSGSSNQYVVSDVFDDPEGKEYEEFLSEKPLCYADIEGQKDMPVTVYEILLCDPIKDFAKSTLTECLDLQEGTYLLVENSERFKAKNLFKKIPTLLSADEPLPQGVVITPQETEARKAEKQLSLLLAIFCLTAICPVIFVLWCVFRLIKLIKRLFNKLILDKIRDKLSYS